MVEYGYMAKIPLPQRFYAGLPELIAELDENIMADIEDDLDSEELPDGYISNAVAQAIAISAAEFASALAMRLNGEDALLMVVQLTNGFTQACLQREWIIGLEGEDEN